MQLGWPRLWEKIRAKGMGEWSGFRRSSKERSFLSFLLLEAINAVQGLVCYRQRSLYEFHFFSFLFFFFFYLTGSLRIVSCLEVRFMHWNDGGYLLKEEGHKTWNRPNDIDFWSCPLISLETPRNYSPMFSPITSHPQIFFYVFKKKYGILYGTRFSDYCTKGFLTTVFKQTIIASSNNSKFWSFTIT